MSKTTKRKKDVTFGRYRLIAIDPGQYKPEKQKSAWCYAISKDPYPAKMDDPKLVIMKYGYELRTEVVGNNIFQTIKKDLAEISEDPDFRKETLIVIIEEPIGTIIKAIKGLMSQVGAAYKFFRFDLRSENPRDGSHYNQVILVRPEKWKINLRDTGLIPDIAGNLGARDKVELDEEEGKEYTKRGFQGLIQERFNRPNWDANECSAFGLIQYAYKMADPIIKAIEIDRAQKIKAESGRRKSYVKHARKMTGATADAK